MGGGGAVTELAGALGSATGETNSVAWGDMDGDGDLDLVVGNGLNQVSRVYRNDEGGVFTEVAGALGSATDVTESVAWGDMDGDGDLDLVVGNASEVNRLYENTRQGWRSLPDNAPSVGVTGPYSSTANFYASATVLDSPTIPITYTLSDPEGDPVGRVEAFYSMDGGGKWYTATSAFGSALSFDGVDDVVDAGDRPGLIVDGPFTEEAWIHPTSDYTGHVGILGHTTPGSLAQRAPSLWIYERTWVVAGFGDGTNYNWTATDGVLVPDAWNHVAATFDGTEYAIYVNGERVCATSIYAGRTPYPTPIRHIGRVDNHFEGMIDEVRIWNVARSQAEIRANMYRPLDGDEPGLLAYWPFDEGAGEVAHDRSANGNDGSLGGGMAARRPRWVDENARTAGLFCSGREGLIGYWPFEEGSGTTASDDSGHGYHLSLNGPVYTTTAPSALTGRSAYALDFDGLDDAASNHSIDLVENLQDLTIALWVQPHVVPTSSVARFVTLENAKAVLRIQNGDLHFYMRIDGSLHGIRRSGVVTTGVYQHVAGTYDSAGDVMRLYHNGVEVGSLPVSGTVSPGSRIYFNSLAEPYDGLMDDVRIYARALYTVEVKALASGRYFPSCTHIFPWDTFGSGLFGQSDNVVLRMVAYPQPAEPSTAGTYKYYHGTPLFQRPYASATTFPFRVRGTQVQVYSETVSSGVVVSNAIVYRLPKGQTDGAEPMGGVGTPFSTDHNGYLRGRGQLAINDTLFAMLPVHSAVNYEGALTYDGVGDYVTVTHDATIDPVASLWSVSAWVRTMDPDGGIVYKDSSAAQDFYELSVSGGQAVFSFSTGDATTIVSSTSAVADGLWHHVVGVRTGTRTGQIYVDGTLEATASSSGSLTTIDTDTALILGKDRSGNYFWGEIDEVRIWNVARTDDEIQVEMAGVVADDAPGLVAYWNFNQADIPASGVCADQTPSGNDGTLVGATWEGAALGGYTVYHTGGRPTATGFDAFTVSEPGVQAITVTAEHPLILYDLSVSLEWAAREDTAYLERLESDIVRASELLYDWTNGQAALGKVTIYHDKVGWHDAHVRVYASNRLRPNAVQGGLTTDILTETVTATGVITYGPGQVRIGAEWNRYGESSGTLGEDWPRTLAHELGHYLLFLDDNYLGFEGDLLVPVSLCPGAMSDPYRAGYGEFHPDEGWASDCTATLSHQVAGRSDWSTIAQFYPWLHEPGVGVAFEDVEMEGPNVLPLAVTRVVQDPNPPEEPSETLDVPLFYLMEEGGGGRYSQGSRGRAFLFRGERVTDLGGPTADQVHARGARADAGDVVCVYDVAHGYQGCEEVRTGDDTIAMRTLPDWRPDVRLSTITTETVEVSVWVTATGALKARFYRIEDAASDAITLTRSGSGGAYVGAFSFPSQTLPFEGYVLVWEDADGDDEADTTEAQALTDYSLGGNPGFIVSRGGFIVSRGGFIVSRGGFIVSRGGFIVSRGEFIVSRGGFIVSRGAPGMSADGRALVFARPGELEFGAGELFAVQTATHLPGAPPWATAVGQGYWLALSEGATVDLSVASIGIQYLGSQVPPGEESWLRVYYWDEGIRKWTKLPTELDAERNMASAQVVGPGLYALMSSLELPIHDAGWNMVAYPVEGTRPVTEALRSIDGYYGIVYGYDALDDADPWKVYGVGVDNYVNDLHELTFGQGYWISVTQAITLYLKGSSDAGADVSVASGMLGGPPATYYGTVQAGNRFTPTAGMQVYATIDDRQCGQGETLEVGSEIVYSINAYADSPGGAAGCGEPGDTVTFYVDGS